LTLAAAATAVGYPQGADPGYTDGFGERTCQEYHFDNPLNDPAGSLDVSGVPSRYTPGTPYPLTITVARMDQCAGQPLH